MALQILLSATLRRCVPGYDGAKGHTMEIQPGTSIRELVRELGLPENEVKLIMVNGVSAHWDTILEGSERLALFPPVGGG